MAITFTSLVFFGDSLTDDGNLPEPYRPGPPYADGKFSNGLIYSEVLPGELGLPSSNFAFGGAEAVTDLSDPADQASINLPSQVSQFLDRTEGHVPDGMAAVIFIGNNDYLRANPTDEADAIALVERVLASVNSAIAELASAGTDHIILYTLPDVSATPLGRGLTAEQRTAADAVITANNTGLKLLASAYEASGVDVRIVDINRLTDEVVTDPETFGLRVVDVPLYVLDQNGALVPTGVGMLVGDDKVAFFDPRHPTEAAHGIVAAFSEATLRAGNVDLRSDGDNRVLGRSAMDFIFTGVGHDRIHAGNGNDVVFAGLGDDAVHAGPGNDLIAGGGGADWVSGGSGTDLIAGNAGADWLSGGSGDDVIVDGSGSDHAFGETGNDLLFVARNDPDPAFDCIDGGSGMDSLRLSISKALFDSEPFQEELAAFSVGLDCERTAFTFETLGLTVRRIEHVEINVDGRAVAEAGSSAAMPSPAVAALLRNAELWGLISF